MMTIPMSDEAPTPFELGYRDGYEDGRLFGIGLTWDDDQDANEDYDQGVNAGQAAASLEGR